MFQCNKARQSDKKDDNFIDNLGIHTKPESLNASTSSQGKGGKKK